MCYMGSLQKSGKHWPCGGPMANTEINLNSLLLQPATQILDFVWLNSFMERDVFKHLTSSFLQTLQPCYQDFMKSCPPELSQHAQNLVDISQEACELLFVKAHSQLAQHINKCYQAIITSTPLNMQAQLTPGYMHASAPTGHGSATERPVSYLDSAYSIDADLSYRHYFPSILRGISWS
jgi:hypothetical protein